MGSVPSPISLKVLIYSSLALLVYSSVVLTMQTVLQFIYIKEVQQTLGFRGWLKHNLPKVNQY